MTCSRRPWGRGRASALRPFTILRQGQDVVRPVLLQGFQAGGIQLRMILLQEAKDGPRTGKGLMQLGQGGKRLAVAPDLPLRELQGFSTKIGEDVYQVLTLDGSVASRNHIGGNAPQQVKAAIRRARKAFPAL